MCDGDDGTGIVDRECRIWSDLVASEDEVLCELSVDASSWPVVRIGAMMMQCSRSASLYFTAKPRKKEYLKIKKERK